MKRIITVIICIISILFTCNYNVYAKDTVLSLNKYSSEELKFIEDSYDQDGNKDGMVSAGTFLKELVDVDDKEYEDYQIMLIKYNNKGRLLWKYSYGKTTEDKISALSYTYDENGNVSGYLLVVPKTKNVNEKTNNTPVFIMVDLEGKEESIKDSNLSNTEINKIITISSSNKKEYILIGHKEIESKEIGVIARYDDKLNLIWEKEINGDKNIDVVDITYTKDENNTINYIVISKTSDTYKVLKYDSNGNLIKEIKNDFESGDRPQVNTSSNGFILYGITYEVKLKNNKTTSYYLEKYNLNEEKEWETIGTVPIDPTFDLSIKELMVEDKVSGYLMMYRNDDTSIEVVKIDLEGNITEKVKKIKNDYYEINAFNNKKNTIYLVGQINCPEDESCEYDSTSLYLISDEEKVIEVESDTNTNIIVFCIGIVALILILILIKRRKKIDNEISKLQKKKKK